MVITFVSIIIIQNCIKSENVNCENTLSLYLKVLTSYLNLDLPDDVIDANNTDRFLLLVVDDGGLGLYPDIPARFGEETILPCFALSFGEHCNKINTI